MALETDPQTCFACGGGKFFVTTMGIEVCSRCYTPTGNLTRATGRLSTEQIDLEKELIEQRINPASSSGRTSDFGSED